MRNNSCIRAESRPVFDFSPVFLRGLTEQGRLALARARQRRADNVRRYRAACRAVGIINSKSLKGWPRLAEFKSRTFRNLNQLRVA